MNSDTCKRCWWLTYNVNDITSNFWAWDGYKTQLNIANEVSRHPIFYDCRLLYLSINIICIIATSSRLYILALKVFPASIYIMTLRKLQKYSDPLQFQLQVEKDLHPYSITLVELQAQSTLTRWQILVFQNVTGGRTSSTRVLCEIASRTRAIQDSQRVLFRTVNAWRTLTTSVFWTRLQTWHLFRKALPITWTWMRSTVT